MSYSSSYSDHNDQGDTNWSYVAIGGVLIAAGAYLIFRGVNQDDGASQSGKRPVRPLPQPGRGDSGQREHRR